MLARKALSITRVASHFRPTAFLPAQPRRPSYRRSPTWPGSWQPCCVRALPLPKKPAYRIDHCSPRRPRRWRETSRRSRHAVRSTAWCTANRVQALGTPPEDTELAQCLSEVAPPPLPPPPPPAAAKITMPSLQGGRIRSGRTRPARRSWSVTTANAPLTFMEWRRIAANPAASRL